MAASRAAAAMPGAGTVSSPDERLGCAACLPPLLGDGAWPAAWLRRGPACSPCGLGRLGCGMPWCVFRQPARAAGSHLDAMAVRASLRGRFHAGNLTIPCMPCRPPPSTPAGLPDALACVAQACEALRLGRLVREFQDDHDRGKTRLTSSLPAQGLSVPEMPG